jgi:hypothetical protein
MHVIPNFIFEDFTFEMRNRITINGSDIINNQRISAYNYKNASSGDLEVKTTNLEILVTEGCEDFVNYIEWLGLTRDPNLVVLSSMHHYYFDAEEMKSVRTLVNLKELNQIRQITSFIHSIFHVLPLKSYFIGCFVDNQELNGYSLRNKLAINNSDRNSEPEENGISSKIPFFNMLYKLLDSKTNRRLSMREVTLLLSDRGFKVQDMTELNGLTYFCAQKFLSVLK